MSITEVQFLDIVNILTTGTAGVVGWVVGRRKQKNDFLSDLQSSIDLLASKNKTQVEEIIKLHEDVILLRDENSKLRQDIEKLHTENARLYDKVTELSKNFKSSKTVKV